MLVVSPDIDECKLDSNTCGTGKCSNNEGSYTCDCTGTGFTGDQCDTGLSVCLSVCPSVCMHIYFSFLRLKGLILIFICVIF